MTSILDKILEKKRVRVEEAARKVPFSELEKALQNAPDAPSFFDALTPKNSKPAVIAELKKASPSRGLIRENFDAQSLAKCLEKSGAAALSVLTEEDFFLGCLENLKIAKSAVKKIPLLRKDFIFCKYQLLEAKIAGASAALLIARMLDEKTLKELLSYAEEIGLDILCETHNAKEIETSINCGAKIIGVNSRDLATFKTDISSLSALLKLIPNRCKKVAESGINTAAELDMMMRAGADACLIGSALMEKPDPAQALQTLLL
ncbi:MAG: indole-3-glycerol phosphate synthase TrpC [Opitutales bacterium]|nr:indole-3-glycerol phosphate synthase TrpC [Opitutales bacterium]